jgi:dTDP-3,4-didehydro-2,6-dideoxy-alpha-D-glucose 3-reductase
MEKIINIGIIGCASIAQKHVIPTLLNLDEFKIVGIASRSVEKANAVGSHFNIKPFYSYESLLKMDTIEAIYIPLPISLHYEWIKKAIDYGIHVLVEKSMGSNYGEVLELNRYAEEKKIILIENFQFRFHSQLEYILQQLKQGVIGEVRNFRSSFGFPPFNDLNNIRYEKKLGGGALLDAGAYPIKLSQIVLGNDLYVDSASQGFTSKSEVDIWGSAVLKKRGSSITSQISFGFDNYYQNNIEIWGSEGKIYTNRIFTAPPGYIPIIELENNDGKDLITLKADHHFKNMLQYFYQQICKPHILSSEYAQNINQARLIEEFTHLRETKHKKLYK